MIANVYKISQESINHGSGCVYEALGKTLTTSKYQETIDGSNLRVFMRLKMFDVSNLTPVAETQGFGHSLEMSLRSLAITLT